MNNPLNPLANVQIVLCNTSHPGNIGSAARAMKTMGIHNLTLVDPLALPDDHSLALASNARDVVQNAKITASLSEAIANSHIVIGMTGRKREFSNRLQSPKDSIPEIFAAINNQEQVSIVFGNEQNGLSIEQLAKCNRLVTIPGNPVYFSLNLAQAVQIMCYEIYSNYNPNLEHLINPVERINQHDIEYLLKSFNELFEQTGFLKNKNVERTLQRIQRILHKADLEREEADLLHGILAKSKAAVLKSRIVKIRQAMENELEEINTILKISKGYWDYDKTFMDSFMNNYKVTIDYISQETLNISTIENKISGFYGFSVKDNEVLELDYFFILPEYIGKGMGRQLWEHAIQTAKKYNKPYFTLWSDPGATEFYVKMGCEQIGTRQSSLLPDRFPPVYKFRLK